MKKIFLCFSVVLLICLFGFYSVAASDDLSSLDEAVSLSDAVSSDESTVLDSGQCGENLFWELDSEGLLRIFGEGPMYDYNKYYEPSPWYKYRDEPYISEDGTKILDKDGNTYLSTEGYFNANPNGYKVKEILIEEGITYIGDWAFYRVCVEEITVPETVEATGIFCFRYSPTLKVLNLPDSLKVLDDYAISRNYELETINMGNSLEAVGTAGFNNNPSLKSLVLPDTCTTINKQMSPAYAQIDYSKVGLLEKCSSLAYIDFGSVTDIPQRTCLGASLETVVIPNTVESIGDYAFYLCSSLKSVVFEEGSVCKTINNTAFSSCSSLESIKGGVSLETLGVYTSISTLTDFDFSTTNKTFEKSQFAGTSLKEVRVSNNISVIPVSCFNGMKSLEKIYLPETLTEIKASSFNYCYSLTDVYYDGTLAQWLSIQKASGWSYQVNSECMLHLADGTAVSLWYKPAASTVTFKDHDGTELSVQKVEYGASATAPTTPQREGYTFIGWDTDFSSVIADTVVTAQYTKNVVIVATGKLSVDVIGGTGFTISVNGSTARPQGGMYINSKLEVGATVTLTANSTNGENFIGWVNPANGQIYCAELSYTFVTSGNDSFKAVYATAIEGVQMVTFKNDKAGSNGRILDMQYYASEDAIVFPDDPTQVGFDFAGWSMTEAEIQIAIAKGEDVTVLATWERQQVYVNVTVSGGTGGGKVLANSAVTVTANAAPAGQKFAYWTDADGNIKSYSEEYKLYPAADTTVTAVFVAEDEEVEQQILISLDYIDYASQAAANKAVFGYSWYLPSEYTIVKAGLVAVNKDNYNEETLVVGSSDSNVYDRYSSSELSTGSATWSKSNVTAGQTWVAKAYVQYKDAEGTLITVYSDLIEAVKTE